jgi:hypothetical protein
MDSERRSFKPAPGDIKDNSPEATDKPRKVNNPDCKDCSGSGFRTVLTDSKIHKGQKARRMTDCFCTRMVYGGLEYMQPQLPAGPASAEEENRQAAEVMRKIPNIAAAAKRWPSGRREQSDAEYSRRRGELQQQAEMVKNKFL